MDDLLKRALINEINSIVEKRNSSMRKKEEQMELQLASSKQHNFKPYTTIDSILKR